MGYRLQGCKELDTNERLNTPCKPAKVTIKKQRISVLSARIKEPSTTKICVKVTQLHEFRKTSFRSTSYTRMHSVAFFKDKFIEHLL